MEVYEALTLLREKAVKDPALRNLLLKTRNSRTPLSDFCRLSTQAGIELYEMDLLSAGRIIMPPCAGPPMAEERTPPCL